MKTEKSSAGMLYGIFRSLCIFALLALACSFVLGFFYFKAPELLAQFETPYKTTHSFVIFIRIFSVVQLGVFLFGFSLLFSKMDAENILERYQAMRAYLKTLCIILTVIFACNVLLTEFIKPLLQRKLKAMEDRTEVYAQALADARNFTMLQTAHAKRMGLNAAKNALEINPNSKEAQVILQELTLQQAAFLETEPKKPSKDLQTTNLNATALLNLANAAIKRRDFFSAHYFASQACRMSIENSAEHRRAAEMLQKAWHAIENGDDSLEEKNRALYEKKCAAYSALQSASYIKAFQLFSAIKEEIKAEDDTLNDIQVNYFLNEIRTILHKKVFYYEDLEQAPPFKNMKHFVFQINNGEHKLYEIEIGSIAYRKAKANAPEKAADIYLKDLKLRKYNYLNQLSSELYSNYARLIPRLNDELKSFSTLQLSMMSDDRTMPDVFPEILSGYPSEHDILSQDLPISVENFLLALNGQTDAEQLDLATLRRLFKMSETFGFDTVTFSREMLLRISFPFLLFVLGIALASLSWNFRFDQNQFRFAYIIVVPLIFLLAAMILELSVFVTDIILNFYLTHGAHLSFLFALLSWMLAMIIYSLKFYRQAKN